MRRSFHHKSFELDLGLVRGARSCAEVSLGHDLQTGQGGACVSYPEACLRLRQGAMPGHREEPSPAVPKLLPGEPVLPPQTSAVLGQ